MPLCELTGKLEGVIPFAYYYVGLLSIGVAYIDCDGEDLSSLVAYTTAAIAALFSIRVIDTLRVSQGLQSSVGIVRLLLLLMLRVGLNRVDGVVESHWIL